ncbi:SusC/RagA family TonB-linked outer membrane protein [Gaetbulibacter sp. M235]|uniref:SusC/RagA family TonB-linked outer membrane protein n=1 Tax=Gaetbulibacter sp. M235 TaxID=3126510 RepID=UPI00374F2C71
MKNNLTNVRFKKRDAMIIMRALVFLCCFSVFSLTPENIMSQNTKITVDADKTVSIDEVFIMISNQTDYNFIYSEDLFQNTSKVHLKKGKVKVSDLLNECITSNNLDFTLTDDNAIIIKQLPKTVLSEQELKVSGIVTDENKIPIPGVAVLIKGTKKGTTTDINGHFLIEVEGNFVTLQFLALGYETQEIKLGDNTLINIVLKESSLDLNEILVTGYQNISAERATGSFSKLKAEELKSQRLNSLDKVLEGRIVGYQNGVIRGTTSMRGLTTPLYVIDGFPIENTRYNPETFRLEENLPNLNLEDIESITVLKDAAASSIYGARAANGVIVITTKKAKVGKTNISFSSTLTVTPFRNYNGNLTDSGDIIGLEREWAAGNPNLAGPGSSSYAASLLSNAAYTSLGMQSLLNYYAGNISESANNNRLDALSAMGYKYYDDIAKYAKRDQYLTQHNFSLGTSSETNSFIASITYKGNKFEDRYSKDESIGINLKNSTEIADWLTLDLGTYVNYNKNDRQTFNALNPGFKYQPYNQLVNDDGTNFTSTAASRYNDFTLQAIQNYGLYNMDITPMDEFKGNIDKTKSFLNRTFVKFNVKFSDALSYNAMFQYEYGVDRSSLLRDKNSYSVRNQVNGLATISNSNTAVYNLPYGDILNERNQFSNAYNFRQQLNFDKTFDSKHDVTALVGMEMRHSKLEYKDNTRYGWDEQTLSFTPVNQADLLKVYGPIFGGYMSQNNFSVDRELLNRYVSFYGNAGYTYDRRYTITGSLRWDRSNLWGTDNKYQNKPTWSTGASWNIDRESFFQTSWIDMLKLRVSYGIGGNIAKDSAPYLTAYYSTNNNVGGTQGSVRSRPNPELSWEKTTTTNLGLNFAFFKNRLSGAFDFYNKKGEDLLSNSNGIPTEGWGYSTYTINNGKMTNKGIELSLDGTIIKTPTFSWEAGFMYAHNKNEVTYVNVEAPVYFLQLDYPSEFPRVGKNFNSIYGYKWAGLSSTGLPQVNDASGTPVSYNPADLLAIEDYGTTVPTQSGSFNTSFSYKNFSLSALFIYQLGHKMRNTFLPMLPNNYSRAVFGYITDISVVNKRIEDRWQQPGDEAFTDVPRVVYEYDPDFNSDLQSIYSYADINIIDASNVRLSNISLGYQLPSSLINRVKLQDVRFNLNIENVFTVAKSKDAKYLLGGYQSPNFVFGVNVNF